MLSNTPVRMCDARMVQCRHACNSIVVLIPFCSIGYCDCLSQSLISRSTAYGCHHTCSCPAVRDRRVDKGTGSRRWSKPLPIRSACQSALSAPISEKRRTVDGLLRLLISAYLTSSRNGHLEGCGRRWR